jgi:hypothetical protein
MTSQINGFCNQTDQNYALNINEQTKKEMAKVKIFATATLVAGIALTILGAALVASGAGTVAGVMLISVSLPMCYFSYNISKTLENSIEILDNPNDYLLYEGSNIEDDIKVRNKLRKNTICFNWFYDWLDNKILMLSGL